MLSRYPPGRARKGAGQNSFVDGGWAVANRDGVCTAPMHVRPSSDTATKAMPTRRPTAASGVRRTPAGVAGASARRRRGARRRAGAARAPASPVGNQPVSQGQINQRAKVRDSPRFDSPADGLEDDTF
jgi:hypothetical protein